MADAPDQTARDPLPVDPDPRTAPDDGATDGGISDPKPAEGGDDDSPGDEGSPAG